MTQWHYLRHIIGADTWHIEKYSYFCTRKAFAPISVKHILRFLFTIVMAIAFINGASGSDSTTPANQDFEIYADATYLSEDTTNYPPEVYALRQSPTSNSGRHYHRISKKKNCTNYSRTYFLPSTEFITLDLRQFIHYSPSAFSSYVVWPLDILIWLDRLII